MRITFVLPAYGWRPVGGFRVVYEYANHLARRNHDVIVVHARTLPNWKPPAASDVATWLRRTAGALRDKVWRPRRTWQAVDRRVALRYVPAPLPRHIPDADAVFATAWQTAEYVSRYPPNKGTQFYLVMDFYPWLGPRERIEATWRLPLRKATISSWLSDLVRAAGGSDVTAIPLGVDHARMSLRTPLNHRPKTVLMMCSQSAYKAVEDGLEALAIAKQACPDLDVLLFGPGRLPRALPSWARFQENISEAELVGLYNRARVYLCSSRAEGFALPAAEALSCGCALVTTDCGGNREYAEHGVTALVSAPGDPQALARNLLVVLSDDELRVKLAQAGHDRIRGFQWDRSTALLEEFIGAPVRPVGAP